VIRLTRDEISESIFGGFDGLTSALGVIVALAATGSLKTVVEASVALAVGAAASMGAGEWLSDKAASRRRAIVMGLATLCGSIAPAVPFYALTGALAWLCCAAVTLACGAWIAEVRPGGVLVSYAQTFGVLVVAASLAVGASLVAGALA
jgi:VIT1/CCC1 family predicted Fe2+/Mn2+ transporter